MKIKIEIVKKGQVSEFMTTVPRGTLAVGMLLAGDRWSCVSQIVAT